MANTPISGFSSGAPAQSGDEYVIARGGANYKLAGSDIKTLVIGAGSVSVASGKTLTASNTLTLTGTDGSTLNVGTGGTLGALATVSAGTGVATAAGNAVNGSGGFITFATFAPASGKVLTLNNTLTLAGTDSTTMTFPSSSTTVAGLAIAQVFTKAQTFQPDSDAQAGTFRRNSSGQTANVVEIQTEANAFLAAFDKTGALTIGAASGNTGALKLAGTTSGTVTLSTADAAGTWTMKLPTSGGTNGYFLKTDGSGNTSWAAATSSPAGSDTQIQFNNSGSFGASANLTWSSPALTIGVQQTTQGSLVLANTAAGAFATTIKSSNSASAAWTLTLPTSAGTNNYVLKTDGSGNTSWVAQTAATAPGGSDTQIQYNNGGAFGGLSQLTYSGGKINVVSAPFGLSGNISSAAWTTNGIRYANVAATLTDTSSSGTVAAAYTDLFGGNTIAASNANTIFTNYYTMFVAAPTAGTNVTLTNSWAFGTSGSVLVGGPKLRLGAVDVSTSAVAQTIEVQSNTGAANGPDFTIKGSNSGAANDGGSIIFQTATGGAFGTALFIRADKVAIFGSSTSSAFNIQLRQSALGISHANSGGNVALRLTGDSTGSSGGSRITSSANGTVAWNSANDLTSGSADVFLSRAAAATLQLGAADAAAPVAQTLQVQNVVAGTSNTAGTNFTINGSRGTGTGVGGSIIFQVAPAGSSGTTQNALATAMTIRSDKTVIVGVAYTVATLPVAGTAGRRAWVTDATTPTYLGTLTGGGAVVCPVFDNGTAWVSA